MSGSAPQTKTAQQRETQTGGETGAPLQQQLFQIGEMMHDGKRVEFTAVMTDCVLVFSAAALHSRASQSARQTAAALLQYCSTGDARVLLAVQRQLCGIQDSNGDT